jgi:hypothetical protein
MSAIVVRAANLRHPMIDGSTRWDDLRLPQASLTNRRFQDNFCGPPLRWSGLTHVDAISRRLIATALEATQGLPPLPPERVGVSMGSFYGSQALNERMLDTALTRGADHVSPLDFSIDTFNSPGALLGIHEGWRGVNTTFLSGAGGMHALAYAMMQLTCRRAERMVCGAYDEITPFLDACLTQTTKHGKPPRPPASESVAVIILEMCASTPPAAGPRRFAASPLSSPVELERLLDRMGASPSGDVVVLDGIGLEPPVRWVDAWRNCTSKLGHNLGASGVVEATIALAMLSRGELGACITLGGGLGAGVAAILWASP